MTASEWEEMKRFAEEAQREADMAEGEKAGLMKQLKEEHNCMTIKEGREKLAKLRKKTAKEDEALEAEKEAFWGKYDDVR